MAICIHRQYLPVIFNNYILYDTHNEYPSFSVIHSENVCFETSIPSTFIALFITPLLYSVLGDTYGFGMTSMRIPSGESTSHACVTLYYDVPLGTDYTIKQPLAAIEEYLLSLGFTKNKAGEFSKDGIYIAPVDSSLDLLIYVWGENF